MGLVVGRGCCGFGGDERGGFGCVGLDGLVGWVVLLGDWGGYVFDDVLVFLLDRLDWECREDFVLHRR